MTGKADAETYKLIQRNILKKLYANKAFAKGHLLYKRLQSGIPKHLVGFVPEILQGLIKKGLVFYYGRTRYGDAYQLNIQKLKEIEEIVFGGN